jgi:fumarylacetoacetase
VSAAASWVPGAGAGHPFGLHTLAYGAASCGGGPVRLVVRIGEQALDLAAACAALAPELAPLVCTPTLNALLGEGPAVWQRLREAVGAWLGEEGHRRSVEPHLRPLGELTLHLPFEVADYVDFYASEHHAANVGRLLRPGTDPLPAAWKHVPIGYHGRAGTVVVSGTPIRRPVGVRRDAAGHLAAGPSRRLDLEAEIGFVLGNPTRLGEPVPLARAEEHLFGACLVNDWSARDIQAFEYVPLGPFLGKSFATSVSPWVVPLAALRGSRVTTPRRDVPLVPYLDDGAAPEGSWGLDLELSVRLAGTELSRPPFRAMYWTPSQMVAHLTVNGASIRAGDLIASGTVSGERADELGSLIEMTAGGSEPLRLADGTSRTFLQDGDTVVIAGRVVPAPERAAVGLGEVAGEVLPPVEAHGATAPPGCPAS